MRSRAVVPERRFFLISRFGLKVFPCCAQDCLVSHGHDGASARSFPNEKRKKPTAMDLDVRACTIEVHDLNRKKTSVQFSKMQNVESLDGSALVARFQLLH